MPCLRHTSAADSPAACSFSTLMICSSVNLLLRMSVSRRNGLYPNSRASTGSRSIPVGFGPPSVGRLYKDRLSFFVPSFVLPHGVRHHKALHLMLDSNRRGKLHVFPKTKPAWALV